MFEKQWVGWLVPGLSACFSHEHLRPLWSPRRAFAFYLATAVCLTKDLQFQAVLDHEQL